MLAESKLIEKSWERCLKFGFKPEESKKTKVLSDMKVSSLLKETPYLKEVAVPILNRVFPFLKETGHYASLINKEGIIVYTVGDPAFEQEAHHIHMEIGANWQEGEMGTNAIGMVLIEKRPVKVHGDQHFYIGTRFLTCAASPIFLPSGELGGAINISGRKEAYHPYIPLLTEILSEYINKELMRKRLEEDHRLTLAEIDYVYNHFVSDPLVCLDDTNRLIRANRLAQRAIGANPNGNLLKVSNQVNKQLIQDPETKARRLIVSLVQNKDQRLYTFDDIYTTDPQIEKLKVLAKKVAKSDLTCLILGESGTGKELFAQAIHTESYRRNQPFIAINCGAIPDSLIESELFGYEPGAFTGGKRGGQLGIFEAANNGTVFLDEIGEMSPKAQITLLRVLQERRVKRLGGTKSYPINVRVIAATNQDLPSIANNNLFRTDLYYRLREFVLHLPPLKARTDLIDLADYLLKRSGFGGAKLSEPAKSKIKNYEWPGNIRELQSIVKEAAFYADGDLIEPEHLLLSIDLISNTSHPTIPTSIEQLEKQVIIQTLQLTNGNISQTAKQLKISRNTLYRKLEHYHLKI